MVRVRYSGPMRGAHMLSRDLSKDGFQAEFPPPMERRGAGQEIVHVVLEVVSQTKNGLIDYAAVEGLRRAARAFKERYPGVEADVESKEDE